MNDVQQALPYLPGGHPAGEFTGDAGVLIGGILLFGGLMVWAASHALASRELRWLGVGCVAGGAVLMLLIR